MGSFRLAAGRGYLHPRYNFAESLAETVGMSLRPRAGRNLPDKEFYLRTVIVTAAVYWGFGSKLRLR